MWFKNKPASHVKNLPPPHPVNMKQLPAFLFVLVFSTTAFGQANVNSTKAQEPPFAFEQLKIIYDTLIPTFDGLFITHYKRDKDAPVHTDFIAKPSKKTHKWGVIDSSGNVIVPFICDGVKAIAGHKGIASVYYESHSLNTGIPRYSYTGKYFHFTKTGRTEEVAKEFSITVEFISDWHFEEFIIRKGPEFYLPQEYRKKER